MLVDFEMSKMRSILIDTDNAEKFDIKIELNGCEYEKIKKDKSVLNYNDCKYFISLFPDNEVFQPQPYEQLSVALMNMGQDINSTRVSIEKEIQYTKSLPRLIESRKEIKENSVLE